MSVLKGKFTHRLRVLRAEKQLSQENLADMLGLSLNAYSRMERGETEVTLLRVEEVAKALEVEVGELLEIGVSNTYIHHNGTAIAFNSNSRFETRPIESVSLEEIVERLKSLEKTNSR